DGIDGDCDGELPADEADEDGDGWRICEEDCDDGDASVHPDGREVCDGRDDDCDGAVDRDDPSVDPFTCGYCADTSQWFTATYETRTLNPCVLDPTVALCSEFPVLFPDTHTQGNRLHRIIYRNDGAPLRPELLLFLPPGPGSHNNTVMSWAAYQGYRMISLGWQNEPLVENCATSECFDEVRTEMMFGDDTSAHVDIWPSDSVIGRLDTLMAYLVQTYPSEGWDAYWDSANGMRWDQVVVYGWSVGAGQGAYLGMLEQTRSQVHVSGPLDILAGTAIPADWESQPRATPECQQWAMYHQEEPGANNPSLPDLFPEVLSLIGIDEEPVDVDLVAPPYGGARMMNTAKTDYQEYWCTPHQAMAMDECMHRDLSAMYTYAFCEAGAHLTCP
ncbi:MAG: hypothetical protein KC621_18590, partial [Myxococcales bacterium]|nr:hypothetical protein [Myxococcales bacterium]